MYDNWLFEPGEVPARLRDCFEEVETTCGAPWYRVIAQPDMSERPLRANGAKMDTDAVHLSNNWQDTPKSAGQAYQEWRNANPDTTLGWRPSCKCYGVDIIGKQPKAPVRKKNESDEEYAARFAVYEVALSDWYEEWARLEPVYRVLPVEPATVLDPFGGSGTVAVVAEKNSRNAVLCELNPDYAAQAEDRIRETSPLFANVEVVDGLE